MMVSNPCIVCACMTCPLCGLSPNCSHWCCFSLTGFRNTWTACIKCEQELSSLSVAGSSLLSRKLPSVVYSPNMNQIPIAFTITSLVVSLSMRCNCNATNGSTSGSYSGVFSYDEGGKDWSLRRVKEKGVAVIGPTLLIILKDSIVPLVILFQFVTYTDRRLLVKCRFLSDT